MFSHSEKFIVPTCTCGIAQPGAGMVCSHVLPAYYEKVLSLRELVGH